MAKLEHGDRAIEILRRFYEANAAGTIRVEDPMYAIVTDTAVLLEAVDVWVADMDRARERHRAEIVRSID